MWFVCNKENPEGKCMVELPKSTLQCRDNCIFATASQCGCFTGFGSVIYSKWHSMLSWLVGWFLVHPLGSDKLEPSHIRIVHVRP